MDLWKGKIAVVTGASSGIGASVAIELAKTGVNVVGLARRKNRIEELAANNASLPGKIHAIECDISDRESIKKVFALIRDTFGGVDILINNAGIAKKTRTFEDGHEEELLNIINVNLVGSLLCAKEAFKSMKERDTHGYIINVNSVFGHNTNFLPELEVNVYPATKHAITSMTSVMRSELVALKNRKIRISSISPGCVKTEIQEVSGYSSEIYNLLPWLEPSSVANAIIYMLGTPEDVHISELTIRPVGEAF